MKRSKLRPGEVPRTVEDLEGGEFVRLDAGLFRATHFVVLGERQGILLRDDLSETRDKLWLAPRTRVLEVLHPSAERRAQEGDEYDPLLGGCRDAR